MSLTPIRPGPTRRLTTLLLRTPPEPLAEAHMKEKPDLSTWARQHAWHVLACEPSLVAHDRPEYRARAWVRVSRAHTSISPRGYLSVVG